MKVRRLLINALLPAFLINTSCDKTNMNEVIVQVLDQDWEMTQVSKEEWIPASIPGSVHTDLLNNNKIEDPFYRLNEHELQWIDKVDWEYRSSFKIDKLLAGKQNIELKFKGLDTYADVYLNDSLILKADNMFREWIVPCEDLVKNGKNELRILFRSPITEGIKKYDNQGFIIPVSDNDLAEIGQVPGNKKVSVYTRKAGYHFGWDWGPRFVTSGIWKPVYLEAWDQGRIKNVQFIQHELTTEKALLKARVELELENLKNGEIIIYDGDQVLARRKLPEEQGIMQSEIPFEIENPSFWWPNGMGEQSLYNLRVELQSEGEVLDKEAERIGLRTIELVTAKDEIGNTFHFKVNGKPVFMKGANYIPQDSFLDRVTPKRYEHVIQSAADANMNMLRVWGGGIYEKDIFYDLCDEKGILVWQDFMFACAMFPGDPEFLNNVEQEAIDNVKRLRNHPSIALWCGNNENLSAWLRWGWKDREIREQGQEVADKLWKAYEDVFHDILPAVVKQEDSDRYYWASSSSADMGIPDNLVQGDLHYWGVWWGKEPFSSFKENTGRFMSEYGFQSFPEMRTIKSYTEEEDHDIYSEVMKSHQRSSIGNETIEIYMDRDYNTPEAFEDFIYVGQVLQGEGIRRAIELHRVQMPYCMGSLYWQIDDCWPVASWSGMDYYGRWKALHYRAKEAFKQVIIVPETDENTTRISLVSDSFEDIEGSLKCSLIDFEGKTLWNETLDATAKASSSTLVFSFDHNAISMDPSESVLHITFLAENKSIDEALWYYVKPGDLNLPESECTLEVTKLEEKLYKLEIQSDKLLKNLFIDQGDVEGFLSDNYFDVLPGRKYEVTFKAESSDGIPGFTMKSLIDSY